VTVDCGYAVCCEEICLISDMISRRLVSFAACKSVTCSAVKEQTMHKKRLWN
jgi:hypothetical protein